MDGIKTHANIELWILHISYSNSEAVYKKQSNVDYLVKSSCTIELSFLPQCSIVDPCFLTCVPREHVVCFRKLCFFSDLKHIYRYVYISSVFIQKTHRFHTEGFMELFNINTADLLGYIQFQLGGRITIWDHL